MPTKRSSFFQKRSGTCIILFALLGAGAFLYFGYRVHAFEYFRNKGVESSFIEEHYRSPAEVKLRFPKQKRNLIYLFLESIETTYADADHGGGFSENYIPELTALANDGTDFSGESGRLNGAYVMPGATWTMGAMFAQSSGLPLMTALGQNAMASQEQFFPGIDTLGDILNEEGYRQVLLLGSDAVFGGRRLYYEQHGQFDIYDYPYSVQKGWTPENYRVWWGYEDEKLFENAKTVLSDLSRESEPFNLTLLTADTHFPDGYVCDLCRDEFKDNQYANVVACSSRQVKAFIDWVREQPFYENTTIVISGDHLTMDEAFCKNVQETYVRKTYTLILNAAHEENAEIGYRDYTTFDLFPTTLSAMGVEIEGHRLGLGTDLFSEVPTLSEQYGFTNEYKELNKNSEFMTELMNTDEETKVRIEQAGEAQVDFLIQDATLLITVSGLQLDEDEPYVYADIVLSENDNSNIQIGDYAGADGDFRINVPVEEYRSRGYQTIFCQMVIRFNDETEVKIGEQQEVSIK